MTKHCPTCACHVFETEPDVKVRRAMSEYHEFCAACGVVKAKSLKQCEACGYSKPKETTMKLKIVMLAGLLFMPGLSEAFTCANTTTCTVTATYTEPKVNANGTSIDDLKETVLTLSVNGTAATPIVTPATAPTGGGIITKTATVAAPSCKSTKVDGTAAAIDTVGAPSVSTPATLTVDRTKDAGCEPGPTTNFTLN